MLKRSLRPSHRDVHLGQQIAAPNQPLQLMERRPVGSSAIDACSSTSSRSPITSASGCMPRSSAASRYSRVSLNSDVASPRSYDQSSGAVAGPWSPGPGPPASNARSAAPLTADRAPGRHRRRRRGRTPAATWSRAHPATAGTSRVFVTVGLRSRDQRRHRDERQQRGGRQRGRSRREPDRPMRSTRAAGVRRRDRAPPSRAFCATAALQPLHESRPVAARRGRHVRPRGQRGTNHPTRSSSA